MTRGWRWFHYYLGCAAMYVPLRYLTDVRWEIATIVGIAFGFVWEWQAIELNKRWTARRERILREREMRRDHS